MKRYFVKHFCEIPPPYGGITVFVKRLSLSLSNLGFLSGAFTHNADIISIPCDYRHLFKDRFPQHTRSVWGLLSVPRLLKVLKNYQIFHNHTCLNSSILTWCVHKITGIPVVWTIHNQMIDRELSCMNGLDFFFFRQLASDKSVQFISVNSNAKMSLMELGVKFANEISICPAYIPPVKVGQYEDYLSTQLESFVNSSRLSLLFYAESFATYNGNSIYGTDTIIELFCRAKRLIPDLRLILCISNCDTDTQLKYKLMVPEEFANDTYWQVGPIPEMWPLLESTTVLVRPTSTDGDSVMLREALAMGLPVVASNVTIRPEGCIVYEYGDFEDLFQKTISILSKPYRKSFPQDERTSDMLELYKSLLS